jgi:hypothetical protein
MRARLSNGAAWLAAMLVLGACGERSATPPAPAASAVSAASAPQADSEIAAYLRGAEIQAETDAQRRELQRALADLLAKPADELRAARYAGPQGEPGQRDLAQVLRAHLVPSRPSSVVLDTWLAERTRPDAQAALRDKLAELERNAAASAPR